MRCVISVLGKDRAGIVAGISGVLAEKGASIDDINQTILGDTFTMVMLVDYSAMKIEFSAMKDNRYRHRWLQRGSGSTRQGR